MGVANRGSSTGDSEKREEESRMGERGRKEETKKKKIKGRCVNLRSQFAILKSPNIK